VTRPIRATLLALTSAAGLLDAAPAAALTFFAEGRLAFVPESYSSPVGQLDGLILTYEVGFDPDAEAQVTTRGSLQTGEVRGRFPAEYIRTTIRDDSTGETLLVAEEQWLNLSLLTSNTNGLDTFSFGGGGSDSPPTVNGAEITVFPSITATLAATFTRMTTFPEPPELPHVVDVAKPPNELELMNAALTNCCNLIVASPVRSV